MQSIQQSEEIGASILTNVVGEFRDAIESAGTALGDSGTIPDLVRNHAINRTRWLWLCEFPAMKAFQTAERSKLNDAAEKLLTDILSRDVRPPAGDGSDADQSPSPSFGERGGTRATDPNERNFTPESQDGI